MRLLSKKRIALNLGSQIFVRGVNWVVVGIGGKDWFHLQTDRHPRFGEAQLDMRFDDSELVAAFDGLRVLAPQVVFRYDELLEFKLQDGVGHRASDQIDRRRPWKENS